MEGCHVVGEHLQGKAGTGGPIDDILILRACLLILLAAEEPAFILGIQNHYCSCQKYDDTH